MLRRPGASSCRPAPCGHSDCISTLVSCPRSCSCSSLPRVGRAALSSSSTSREWARIPAYASAVTGVSSSASFLGRPGTLGAPARRPRRRARWKPAVMRLALWRLRIARRLWNSTAVVSRVPAVTRNHPSVLSEAALTVFILFRRVGQHGRHTCDRTTSIYYTMYHISYSIMIHPG